MKICMYQMSVSMDNQQNIAKLKHIPDCDILVLPEMWNCPYHNDALKTAYLRHDESLEALKETARTNKIWIVAGSICANKLREECKDKGVFLLNVMSSPGAGKTTTLSRTLEKLKDTLHIGIMEADIDSDVDAKTISEYGVRTIQLHTGGMCHLDADMTRQGLHEMGMEDLDLAVLENVGNLVCPAEFDTGSTKNVAILSVPEGDDKPLKLSLIHI